MPQQQNSSLDALLRFANPAALRHLGQSAAARQQQMIGQDMDTVVEDTGPGFMGLTKPRSLLVTGDMRRRWAAEDDARKGAEVGFDLRERYEPADAIRKASIARDIMAPAEEDIADQASRRGAGRYFGQMEEAMRNDKFGRQMQLATEPARIAAGGRQDVETTRAGGRLAEALARKSSSAEIVAAQIDDWTRSGVFGYDRSGNPNPPPASAISVLEQFFNQGGGAGAPGGGVPGAGAPSAGGGMPATDNIVTRQELQEMVSAGTFNSMAAAQQYAIQNGFTIR